MQRVSCPCAVCSEMSQLLNDPLSLVSKFSCTKTIRLFPSSTLVINFSAQIKLSHSQYGAPFAGKNQLFLHHVSNRFLQSYASPHTPHSNNSCVFLLAFTCDWWSSPTTSRPHKTFSESDGTPYFDFSDHMPQEIRAPPHDALHEIVPVLVIFHCLAPDITTAGACLTGGGFFLSGRVMSRIPAATEQKTSP